jgi:hypothetical protein
MSHFPDEHIEQSGGKSRRRSTGRLYGARNYSKQMVQTLLDSVEAVLPIEIEEWQTVADQFNYQFHVSFDDFTNSYSVFEFLNFCLGQPSSEIHP